MKMFQVFMVAAATTMMAASSWAATIGVTEISEGTIRTVYVDKPLVGAKGYVVADWAKGQVRVEVFNFPQSSTGYEAFLLELDIPGFMSKMFVGGKMVAEPPPFDEVAGLVSQWRSLGDVEVGANGVGVLNYAKGDDLHATGLNMIMIFGKVTPGEHAGPEDFSKLMVECNGVLAGTKGSAGTEGAITIFEN